MKKAWWVWALGASFFLAEYFLRVSLGVMVQPLMHTFQIDAVDLSFLSVAFYVTYLGMQLPVGASVDRFGPQRLLTAMAALCGGSGVLFACAHTLWVAEVARLLMGFGAAFAFVGTLKLAMSWFHGRQLGLLAGLTQALGMLGAAIGKGPVALMVGHWGWRLTTLMLSTVLLLIALGIGVFVRDRPGRRKKVMSQPEPAEEHPGLWEGLVRVMRNPQSWINALFAGLLYSPTAALGELWGTSFLETVHGVSHAMASFGVSMIFIGWAVGSPLCGWVSDRLGRRKTNLYLSAVLSLLLLMVVLYVHPLQPMMLWCLLFAFGVANTGLITSYAIAGELNPSRFGGISMAFVNMASVLIGIGFQPAMAFVLRHSWDGRMQGGVPYYNAHAYLQASAMLPVASLLALLVALGIRETFCQPYEATVATSK